MTALVEREVLEAAIAFMRHDGLCAIVGGYDGYGCICGMEAARAALRQPGAEYRRGVEDAAKVAEKSARRHLRWVRNGKRNGASDAACANDKVMAIEAKNLATAIRDLSDSIPDTKGGKDGR